MHVNMNTRSSTSLHRGCSPTLDLAGIKFSFLPSPSPPLERFPFHVFRFTKVKESSEFVFFFNKFECPVEISRDRKFKYLYSPPTRLTLMHAKPKTNYKLRFFWFHVNCLCIFIVIIYYYRIPEKRSPQKNLQKQSCRNKITKIFSKKINS